MKWKDSIFCITLIFLGLAFSIQSADALLSRWEDVPGSLISCGTCYGNLLGLSEGINQSDEPGHITITLRRKEVKVEKFQVSGDIPLGLGGWNIGLLYGRHRTVEWDTRSEVEEIPPRHKVLMFACVLYNVKKKVQRRKYFFWERRPSRNGPQERKGKLKEAAPFPYMGISQVELTVTVDSILEKMRRDDDP